MGMFDTVKAQNIVHKNFKHNGQYFQTKDLDLTLSGYVIFNGRLWKERDGETGTILDTAVDVNYDGELNIYTPVEETDVTRWIAYDLTFEDGTLVNVEMTSDRITEDRRDISTYRPNAPSNRLSVTIDASDLDENKMQEFISSIENKLDALREAIGDPFATINYPALPKVSGNNPFTKFPHVMSVASYVQTVEDFEQVASTKKVEAPNGDSIFFMDEGHMLLETKKD